MTRTTQPIDTTDNTTDDLPADPDEFGLRLMRRLAMMKQDWRNCKAPACRRARACVDARLTCRITPPGPPLSDAEQAKLRHDFQVSLRRKIRRRGGA